MREVKSSLSSQREVSIDEAVAQLSRDIDAQREQNEYRRLHSGEYDAIRVDAMNLISRTMQVLKEIDDVIADAALQFDRYQQHEVGTILISYRRTQKHRIPFFLELIAHPDGGFKVLRMTKEAIAEWSVVKNWKAWHMNPGLPLKHALNIISEAMELRVEVMALSQGRRFKGMRALENQWGSLSKRCAKTLDAMSHAIERDWVVVRDRRARGLQAPRRTPGGVKSQEGEAA